MRARWVVWVLLAAEAAGAGSIADEPVDEAGYDQRRNCVARRDLRRIEILDSRHLVFRLRDGSKLMNATLNACDGMRPDAVLRIRSWDGQQFCRLDDVSVIDAFMPGHCELSWFEPVTDAQLEVVREAIAARARDRLVRRPGVVRARAGTPQP
jgi:hypothetical protein